MKIIGAETQDVIYNLVVRPTCVISHVFAYVLQLKDGSHQVVFHLVSDCGDADTIVRKLAKRATEKVADSYSTECHQGLERFKWVHSKDLARVPERCQVIYEREV